MNAWQDFLTNTGKPIGKWVHYFPIYERHLCSKRNQDLLLVEIGVAGGGSSQMWSKFLGPRAKIVGLDIDESCAAHEGLAVSIRIGNQADETFLSEVVREFGIPDIVIDDGSHQMAHVRASFDYLYPLMPKNSIYIIEDMHTAYWSNYGGGLQNPESFINYSKQCIDQLNEKWIPPEMRPSNKIAANTFSISFYDSVVVYEKGGVTWHEAPVIGKGYKAPF
jgi:cephalosporin hydroxylase